MIVTTTTRDEKFLDDYDYRDFLAVSVNGNTVMSVHDGEPEDNNLGRNFSEVHNVVKLIRLAHEAGKAGEELTFVDETTEHRV
jgi:hypothetical protein